MRAVSASANVLNIFLGAAGGTEWQLSMARVRMLHNEMDAAKVNAVVGVALCAVNCATLCACQDALMLLRAPG